MIFLVRCYWVASIVVVVFAATGHDRLAYAVIAIEVITLALAARRR